MNKYLYLIILLCILIYSRVYEEYSAGVFWVVLLSFINLINRFSRRSVIIETICLYSSFVYLVGPYLGYKYFNEYFEPAVLFKFVMPISSNEYFNYAFPAIIAFIIGLNLMRKTEEEEMLSKIITYVKEMADIKVGYNLIFIGFIAFYLLPFAPSFLKYICTICFLLIFAGITILHLSDESSKLKTYVQIFIVLWLLYNGIKTTMFTIVFYMGVTMVSIVSLKYKVSFIKKIVGIILFLIFTITLQFSKSNYRTLIKSRVENSISINKFLNLFYTTIANFDQAFEVKNLFPLHLRFNNGFYLAMVMKRFPKEIQFDKGEALGKTVLASFVPRLFWPDKPTAGGIYNAKYYMGLVITHTVNVGPIGEAYGSFGIRGGIIYMFLFGMFLGFAHNYFIKISKNKPLLFVFMPMIFYESLYCMENDTMQALNSLIKISIFLIIIFQLFPSLLKPKSIQVVNN